MDGGRWEVGGGPGCTDYSREEIKRTKHNFESEKSKIKQKLSDLEKKRENWEKEEQRLETKLKDDKERLERLGKQQIEEVLFPPSLLPSPPPSSPPLSSPSPFSLHPPLTPISKSSSKRNPRN
jgi:hypothetical protein